jgi:uncharacterized protein (TIGR03435 family)
MPFFGLGSPVMNKTGLTGRYNFTLDWAPDRGAPAADADGNRKLDTHHIIKEGVHSSAAARPELAEGGVRKPEFDRPYRKFN